MLVLMRQQPNTPYINIAFHLGLLYQLSIINYQLSIINYQLI